VFNEKVQKQNRLRVVIFSVQNVRAHVETEENHNRVRAGRARAVGSGRFRGAGTARPPGTRPRAGTRVPVAQMLLGRADRVPVGRRGRPAPRRGEGRVRGHATLRRVRRNSVDRRAGQRLLAVGRGRRVGQGHGPGRRRVRDCGPSGPGHGRAHVARRRGALERVRPLVPGPHVRPTRLGSAVLRGRADRTRAPGRPQEVRVLPERA